MAAGKKDSKKKISAKKSEPTVSKAEKIKPFNELCVIALRQEWEKRYLVEFVKETYKGCKVEVDELNLRQIRFEIDGTFVPEVGYFSVK